MRKSLALTVLLTLLLALLVTAPAFAQQPVTITISPQAGQTASGTATLTPVGSQTQVVLTMTGLTPGIHANHIHVGACPNPGDIEIPLADLNADTQGNASATTMVQTPLATIQATQHALAVHSGPLPAPTIACGNIPVVAGVTAVPAVSGGPDAVVLSGLMAGIGTLMTSGAIWLRRRRALP